jgi:hypothetical protein|nr:MAG TPA: hypothetical protein [Caudoviricetes sp.]
MKLDQNSIQEALEHVRFIIEQSRTKEGVKLPVVIKDHVSDLIEDHIHYRDDLPSSSLLKLKFITVNRGNEIVIYIYPFISDIQLNNCFLIENNLHNLSQIITILEAEYNHQ